MGQLWQGSVSFGSQYHTASDGPTSCSVRENSPLVLGRGDPDPPTSENYTLVVRLYRASVMPIMTGSTSLENRFSARRTTVRSLIQ